MLHASPFEGFNIHAKRVYRHTAQRPSSSTAEMVRVIEKHSDDTVTADNVQLRTYGKQKRSL